MSSSYKPQMLPQNWENIKNTEVMAWNDNIVKLKNLDTLRENKTSKELADMCYRSFLRYRQNNNYKTVNSNIGQQIGDILQRKFLRQIKKAKSKKVLEPGTPPILRPLKIKNNKNQFSDDHLVQFGFNIINTHRP